jgi:hypothetical protein
MRHSTDPLRDPSGELALTNPNLLANPCSFSSFSGPKKPLRAPDSAQIENPGKDPGDRLRLFISYFSQDLPLVKQLRVAFAAEGYSVWIAQEDAKLGPWPPQITAAIRRCDLFVVALTARSRESVMVQNEILEAHKQGRQMLIVRLEPGVDFGEWGPILNVWQFFDWKEEQIPRILLELQQLAGHKTPRPFTLPPRKPEKPRSIAKYLAIAAAVLIFAGAGVWFQRAQTRSEPKSASPNGAPLVLAVLPYTDFNETEAESLRYCSLLRSPLGSAFAGAGNLSLWPEQSELTALSKAARDFSASQNVIGVPSGACVAVYTELAKQTADPPSAELRLTLRVRGPDGSFVPSLRWLSFFLKHRSHFSGPAASPRWIAARAGVELARFLVEEALVQIEDKDHERLTANLTDILLEAALRSPQPRIPTELYESSTSDPTESRLEALLNASETKPVSRPAITAVDKAAIEVKANLTPFTRL